VQKFNEEYDIVAVGSNVMVTLVEATTVGHPKAEGIV
jgi:hypothetical protein